MVRQSALLSLLATAAGIFTTAEAGTLDRAASKIPGAYVVEFEDGADTSEFFNHVENLATPRLNLTRSSIFHGASIQFNNLKTAEEHASKVAALGSIKTIWQVKQYSVPRDEVIWTGNAGDEFIVNARRQGGDDVFSTHVMTQVDRLRADGILGTGIKIGVIDTGIDYTHPALGGCYGAGCLVSYGNDLVGDDFDGSNTPVPDDDPYDGCEGHGSHVAGIIAAQPNAYGFTGAAPGVTLGAYRVFGCGGNTPDDVLIDAYIQAFEDGSQIITASIGGASGWSEEPWSVVVSRIVEAGVPCTVSAGNDGSIGQFYTSTAANGKRVTAIASTDNVLALSLLKNSTFTVNNGSEQDFGYTPGEPSAWAGVSLPLFSASLDAAAPADGCTAYPAGTDFTGKVALIRRGSCTFVLKVQNAVDAGAKHVLIFNNAAGASSVTADVPGVEAIGMVTAEQGAQWISLLAAGSTVTVDVEDPATAATFLSESPNEKTGGFASTFTSWGPTFEGDIKPQFAAPGGQILSTFPQTLGSYAILSGTSMACPIAAAIVALIAEVRGTLDPLTIESYLASTANPNLFNDGTQTYPYLAPVAQVGAGLIQAYDAAHYATFLSVSSLAYNDTDNFIDTQNFTIKNTGAEEVTYSLGHVGAAAAYTFSESIYPDPFPGLETVAEYATLAFSESKVTVPAGGEAVVAVIVTPPAIDALRLPTYSGYVTLNGTNGENLSLPYQGIFGSLNAQRVLDEAYVARSTSPGIPLSANATFTLPRANGTSAVLPEVVTFLAFGTALLKHEVVPLSGYGAGQSIGSVFGFPAQYLSRDTVQYDWDGRLASGSFAPAGQYKIVVSALHIFGDASDPAQYDVSETVPFGIRYA